MSTDASNSELKELPVKLIDRNPDNPRLYFRAGEMEELLESIRTYGVQVPISVYKESGRYVLIDGERRWRCAGKLNQRTIPALVQEKPSPLTNLLLMFNIHALREQWDLLTVALKLPKVSKLLERELGREPKVRELASKTGLNMAIIRRCKLLADLPEEFKQELLKELNKPKHQQKITEDLFIEMERALTTTERFLPSAIANKNRVRRVLLEKYRSGVINNLVHFRMIAKIARHEGVGVSKAVAEKALGRLFERNDISIEHAFQASVGEAYSARDLLSRVSSLFDRLKDVKLSDLDSNVVEALKKLKRVLAQLLAE